MENAENCSICDSCQLSISKPIKNVSFEDHIIDETNSANNKMGPDDYDINKANYSICDVKQEDDNSCDIKEEVGDDYDIKIKEEDDDYDILEDEDYDVREDDEFDVKENDDYDMLEEDDHEVENAYEKFKLKNEEINVKPEER